MSSNDTVAVTHTEAPGQEYGVENVHNPLLPRDGAEIQSRWPISQAHTSLTSFAGEINKPSQIGGSASVHEGSSKEALDPNAFFIMFDEIWNKLLMLAKQLRDTMQFYNQKKQELGWGLEINTLKKSVESIEHSYEAARTGAIGGICAGALALAGAPFGQVGIQVGNAVGQMANGLGTLISAGKTRDADKEKALADLQNKGAQSYAKTLDDTLMKAREIMQQMMDMGRSLVEVFSQVLRAISR